MTQLGLFNPRWTIEQKPAPRAPWVHPFEAQHEALLRKAGEDLIIFDNAEWNHKSSSPVGLDVEVYRNFCVVCFKRFEDGKRVAFEMSERCELNKRGIEWILERNQTVSFNGLTYDLPIIYLALNGASLADLKLASDKIVHGNMKPWTAGEELGVRVPRSLNHIDLIESNPSVRQGLKMLNGRLHGRYMVDLPYDPEAWLTPRQMNFTTLYCFNDIDATELVFNAMKEPLLLREALGKEYGLDLRNKSDAQVGEAIVKRRVEADTRRTIKKIVAAAADFHYRPPGFLTFVDLKLRKLLVDLGEVKFHVNHAGKVDTPAILEKLEVCLGQMTYAMGIGGLHSTEAHRTLHSDAGRTLIDVDVASQYPRIIMVLGLYPQAMGPEFLNIYGRLIEERLSAKAAGDKVKADGGRIALNGVYGKLGSAYSPLYGPHLLIAITLTGQLSILMLIEMAEMAGIPVVSANTDGVVFFCSKEKESRLEEILATWETSTGFSTERTRYKSIYNSSVNTYIAIGENEKIKRKGWISDPWRENDLRGQMMKNPQMTICSEAVLRFVVDGIPLENTIKNCKDPRSFLAIIKVAGGGTWRGHPLGRAVRYYWSLDGDPILAGTRKVAKTENSKPLLELTEELPEDIDYIRYCEEAVRLAIDLGITDIR